MRFRAFLVALSTGALLAGCGGGTSSVAPSTATQSGSSPIVRSSRHIRSVSPVANAQMVDYPQYTASYAHVDEHGGSPADAVNNGHLKVGLPFWVGNVTDGANGQSYEYAMIGDSPTEPANANDTIKTTIIKTVFSFADYPGLTLDPSQPATGDTTPVIDRTLNSPLFTNYTYPSGNTQYIDAFQRQNFWQTGGSRSDFHVVFDTTNNRGVQTLNVTVPSGKATLLRTRRTHSLFALVDFDWFYSTVPPQILAMTRHNEFAISLAYNVFYYEGSLANCCILGYHDAIQDTAKGPISTYAVAAYTAPGIFTVPINDIHALSHELGEWVDDPLGGNPTPPWDGGQVPTGNPAYCQNNLEVGDPLTGTVYGPITTNGFTYHPQELVDFSWFYHQTPSISQNGAYSNGGTFTSPSTCT